MGPLANLRVIDLTRALAGPMCTLMLGDLGARVIKIETPDGGDDTRGWGPPFLEGESAYFLSVNRNKESLTLNLKEPRGRDVLLRLLGQADVLVENFRPGIMARLGLSYADLRGQFPKLIYASISGFGQDGPSRERPAYDLILEGIGGFMGITGEPDGPPTKVGVAVADICAGMYAAFGILAALRVRDQTGQGQQVDASMLDGLISWLTYAAGIYFATGHSPGRLGNGHPSIVPYQTFQTADGYINVAVGSEAIWRRFCDAVAPALADDPRYATNRDRVAARQGLIAFLEPIFATRSTQAWMEVLDAAGVPSGPIRSLAEVFNDPQVRFRDMVVELTHPVAGPIKQTGVAVKLSQTPGAVRTPPPTLGQHTDAILRELGYSTAEIAQLHRAKVV